MRDVIRVADEVWVATALLQTQNPQREGFRVAEIVDQAFREKLAPTLRPGVQIHASQHCVANKRPNPATYRMLYALPDGSRRLFREGDDFHPYREGGRTLPDREELPERYQWLLEWYATSYAPSRKGGENL